MKTQALIATGIIAALAVFGISFGAEEGLMKDPATRDAAVSGIDAVATMVALIGGTFIATQRDRIKRAIGAGPSDPIYRNGEGGTGSGGT